MIKTELYESRFGHIYKLSHGCPVTFQLRGFPSSPVLTFTVDCLSVDGLFCVPGTPLLLSPCHLSVHLLWTARNYRAFLQIIGVLQKDFKFLLVQPIP